MNALVLAALFLSAPPVPEYCVSVTVLRGDPLGTVPEKNVEVMNRTSMPFTGSTTEGITTTVVYLTESKNPAQCMGISLASVSDKEVNLECSFTFNDTYAVKEAVPTWHQPQMKLGEPKTIRLHSFSADDQLWAIVLVTKREPGKSGIAAGPASHLPQPAPSKR